VRKDIRARLLDAALVEFGAKGFDGASTRAIARRVGAHQPQINYHFASKEALWIAAVGHLFAELVATMRDLPARIRGRGGGELSEVAAVFAELVRRFVRFAARHPELNQIMMHEATADSDRLAWMTTHHVKPLYDTYRPLWRRLRAAGIAAPIDERLAYYVVVGAASLVYANAPEARLLTGIEPTASQWIATHADGLVAMLLPGASIPADRRTPPRRRAKARSARPT
jgi:AcrR family transcriptional regulator